jgi:hypothetical protein
MAWNNTQSFYLHSLSKAFMELVIVEANFKALEAAPEGLKPVLTVFSSLQHSSLFRTWHFFTLCLAYNKTCISSLKENT